MWRISSLCLDGRADRLLVFDSPAAELMTIPAPADGSLDADRVERMDALGFGAGDPQGLAVDPSTEVRRS